MRIPYLVLFDVAIHKMWGEKHSWLRRSLWANAEPIFGPFTEPGALFCLPGCPHHDTLTKTIGGSLSLWDLMPSYNPGLVTGGITRPPDLLENIAQKLTFVKSLRQSRRQIHPAHRRVPRLLWHGADDADR